MFDVWSSNTKGILSPLDIQIKQQLIGSSKGTFW